MDNKRQAIVIVFAALSLIGCGSTLEVREGEPTAWMMFDTSSDIKGGMFYTDVETCRKGHHIPGVVDFHAPSVSERFPIPAGEPIVLDMYCADRKSPVQTCKLAFRFTPEVRKTYLASIVRKSTVRRLEVVSTIIEVEFDDDKPADYKLLGSPELQEMHVVYGEGCHPDH